MTIYKKYCVICNKEFFTSRNTQKLCSITCRSNYYTKLFKHNNLINNCLNCNREFEVSYKCRNHKFCSLSCSTIYSNRHRNYDFFKGDKNPAKRPEVRKKISIKFKGRKNNWMKGKLNPNYGGLKKETKERISNKAKERLKDKTKHPNWKDGKSFELYGLSWTKELKTFIRKRDKFICQICNKNGFSVHHIDYNKKNNDENNLITLCKSCHMKTGYHRNAWIIFFKILRGQSGKN